MVLLSQLLRNIFKLVGVKLRPVHAIQCLLITELNQESGTRLFKHLPNFDCKLAVIQFVSLSIQKLFKAKT